MNKKQFMFLIFITFLSTAVFSQENKNLSNKKTSKKQIVPQINEEFKYTLVFFNKDTYSLHSVNKKTKVISGLKKEEKVKLVIEDLFSIPEEELEKTGLRRAIKPQIKIENVLCSTQTYKISDKEEVKHIAAEIELSRDIIPYLSDDTLDDLVTQIRFTLELSGFDFTQVDLKVKDKKGQKHNLIYFVDHKEE
jgi:hypothetical protein